jgi:MFS family permease
VGVLAVGEALKLALAGFVALAVAMGIGRFAFTPLLPLMQADAGLSLAAGAWLALANYAGYFAGALTARRFASLRASLAVIAAATLAMGFAQPLALWALWRALAGAASAWVLVQVSARCLGRGGDAGIVFAGVGAGSALAGLVCLPVASASHGWLVLGAIACAALVMPMPAPPAEPAAPAPPVWRHGVLIAAYGAYGFGYILPATFIPMMARELIADPAVFGWAWPIFGAAAALSTLAINPLIARVGARRVWLASQLVMAVGVLAPLLSPRILPGYAGIVAAALAVGGTFVTITMAAMREAVRLSAQPAGLMAAMTAAFAAGQIAGPLVVAIGVSMNVALALGAGLLLLGAAALVRPEHGRPAAE